MFLAYLPYFKQEVPGRTNRVFTFIRNGPHRKRYVQHFFYCCVFVAAVTFLASRCLATIGWYAYRHSLKGRIYEIRHWDGLRRNNMYTKFHKYWLSESKVDRGDANRISLLSFFRNKECRLMRLPAVCVFHPPSTFECLNSSYEIWYVRYIMVPESISTVYFIYPSHPLMCLYVHPLIVARQRLGEKSYRGNEYGSNNRGNIVCAKGFGPRKWSWQWANKGVVIVRLLH
jgi:hypothetical protein